MPADHIPTSALIRVTNFRLALSIGWGEEERRVPQPVRFDLEIRLPAPPLATVTDRLEDTVDYHRLTETIRTVASGQPVRLIERLAGLVGAALAASLPPSARLRLTVTKEYPPIDNLEGGAGVEISLDGQGPP